MLSTGAACSWLVARVFSLVAWWVAQEREFRSILSVYMPLDWITSTFW